MRVDLALEHLELHLGGQGRLLLERRCRHLRGQQLAEAGGDGLLGFADVVRTAVVELQRALHVFTHGQRHDDGGVDAVGAFGEADFLGGEQHACLAVGQRGVRGVRADDAAREVMRFLVAGVTQDETVIGDGDGDGRGGGQKQAADALGGFAVQAFLAHGLERLACQLQHVAGLTRAHGIGVHEQADEHGDGQREHHTRDEQRQHADDGRHQVPDEHKTRQRHHHRHEHLEREITRKPCAIVLHIDVHTPTPSLSGTTGRPKRPACGVSQVYRIR